MPLPLPLPMSSPPSFSTGYQFDTGQSPRGTGAFITVERTIAWSSVGTQRKGLVFRVLVLTFMPSATAAESTYGLKEDPTCSREPTPGFFSKPQCWDSPSDMFCPGPGYMARISPLLGFCSSAPIRMYVGNCAPGVALIAAMFASTALYISFSIE